MNEKVTRIYAENLMFEMKRPCMMPVDIYLSTGGTTKHCCWACYNCKTARGIAVEIISSTVDTILKTVEEMLGLNIDNRDNWTPTVGGRLLYRAEVLALIEKVGK